MQSHHPGLGPAFAAGILCLLLCAVAVPIAAADVADAPTNTTTETSSGSSTGSGTTASSTGSGVSVESTTVMPGTFFTGDTGTLTVRLANHGEDAVTVRRAAVASNEFAFLNADTYATVGTLEGGAARDLTFTVKAEAGAGMYYPEVQIDLGEAGSIRYAVPVRIDNSEVQVSLANTPTSYMKGLQNDLAVAIFNPRASAVSGVSVTAIGPGLSVSDTVGFVGALGADQSRCVTFEVTPQESTTLTLTVAYRNGLTEHSTVLTVPMTVGDRSTAADPVVNGVEVASSGGTYTVSGDVTNAGIADARGVVVTVGSPATPVDPNRNYVVGSLAADDFASFELTFTATGARTVPLLVQYKDDDGNAYESSVEVTLSGGVPGETNASAGSAQAGSSGPASSGLQGGPPAGGPGGMGGGSVFSMFGGGRPGSTPDASSLPIVPIAGAVVILLVLGVAWKKGLVSRAGQRLRRVRSADTASESTVTGPAEGTDEQSRE